MTERLYAAIKAEELEKLRGLGARRLGDAAAILDGLVEKDEFTEFLTLPAYGYLE